MLKMMMVALALSAVQLAASAETPAPAQDCPEDAFQQLYALRAGMMSGEALKPSVIFASANAGVTLCPDNSAIQGLSSTIFAILADALSGADAETRETVLNAAYNAALANSRTFSMVAPSPKVRFSDGSEQSVYPYNEVNTYLENVVFTQFLDLHLAGRPQDILSDNALDECPYGEEQSRARVEADSWRKAIDARGSRSQAEGAAGFAGIEARLLALAEACPSEKPAVTFALAEINKDVAEAIIEQIPYGRLSGDERSEALARALAHIESARRHYTAFGHMKVTDSRDELNASYVLGRQRNLLSMKQRIEDFEN
ncbi:hypothetical protein [Henriciella litoralis]|uniref:hypothetical protein n=1 Tax=Henriciella litoralis TaxID=568102 RepID=UPI000A04E21B|nr:hypothetical protein [Henriciella litoralis]